MPLSPETPIRGRGGHLRHSCMAPSLSQLHKVSKEDQIEENMKINIVSRRFVKPITPTPENLRNYKLSCMDEINASINTFAILYYQSSDRLGQVISTLDKSMAQILPQFYPFAGRFSKENHSVDCSDQGAEIVEAHVDSDLVDIIGSRVQPGELNDLLPPTVNLTDGPTDPILSVQINKFKCGGVAISISLSHRIADGTSMATFLSAWAKASRGDDSKPAIIPHFDAPSHFPGKYNTLPGGGSTKDTPGPTIVTKRVLFDSKTIGKLKARVSHLSDNSDRPASKLLVISSFLSEALMRSDRARLGESRGFVITQAINLRERTVPPMSKYTCGNLVSLGIVKGRDLKFEQIVPLLRNACKKAISDCSKMLASGQDGRDILLGVFATATESSNGEIPNILWFSDWTKFGFYDNDFGFGKPIWASVANIKFNNLIVMIDTKENDGIEAWVHLEEKSMAYFQRDQEIKKLSN